MSNVYDVAIIGGGPAGMTSGIYCARARMKTVLLEKAMCGGQALITDVIENFPGFPDGVKGPELADWMRRQAERFGLETKMLDVTGIGLKKGEPFPITTAEGENIASLAVIVATGAAWNTLGIPGEKSLTGRGVSYCATCDGPLFRNKDVVVVGGGDSAIEDALFLAKFANTVTVIHRRDRLRAAKILQERALANKKIRFKLESVASEITGKSKVEGIITKDVKTAKVDTVKCDGVFVLIGIRPNSEFLKGAVKLDDHGYIVTDSEMRSSADGIFAAGDVTKKLLRQVVTATGDGAVAAASAGHYVDRLKGVEYK